MAAQFRATKGPSARPLFAWMKRARSSLPVPAPPVTRTRASVAAAWRASFLMSPIAGEVPTISSTSVGARRCCFSARFSRRSEEASRALRVVVMRRSMESGFSMKSQAPSFMARTAISTLPWPEITTTLSSGRRFFISERASMPPILGSHTSRKTRSIPPRSRSSSPTTASSATRAL